MQLLSQLNAAAAWLLRQRRQPAVWAAQNAAQQSPLRVTARALCSVVSGSELRGAGRLPPGELVLAAEAAGLGAVAWLAELEQAAGSGGLLLRDDPTTLLCLGTLTMLFSRLQANALQPRAALLDFGSWPQAVASLVGAAEPMLRLAAALTQQQQDRASLSTAAAAAEALAELPCPEEVTACCLQSLKTAAALVRCAAFNVNEGRVACTASGSAAVLHCAASFAMLARVAAALPAGRRAAVWGARPGHLCITLVTGFHGLSELAAAAGGGMAAAEQQR